MQVALLFFADPARMSLGSWWLNCYAKLLTAAGMVQCLILAADAVLDVLDAGSYWCCNPVCTGSNAVFARLRLSPNCRSGFKSRFRFDTNCRSQIASHMPISIAVAFDCIKPNAIGSFIPVLELSCRSRIVIGFGLLAGFACAWEPV
ncbi:hypothetical protein Nepgr_026637 [Nepenthes gracilis]|uniref:Uncharacterized protein n=1 Tax=Nepenthes gracilis TaxID=150966 RepID=A0AAD3Y2A0_NEPGR|nr:hypothetical protein Nepgr_026637 [Nepenthes gracilis]